MPIIHIRVNRKHAISPQERIVCGNNDYSVLFAFDSEWDAYETKTARFIYGGQFVDVVFQGDTCPVPVITNATHCAVGVFAGDLRTTTPALVACDKSILCSGGVPADPTPDVYAQIMELLNAGGGGGSGTANKLEVGHQDEYGKKTAQAVGEYSFAQGDKKDRSGAPDEPLESDWRYNEAIGTASIAAGMGAVAYSRASKSMGYRTQTGYPAKQEHLDERPEITYKTDDNGNPVFEDDSVGQAAAAFGSDTVAVGNNSFAEGYKTKAVTASAHAEGYQAEASGFASHSEGVDTKAYSRGTHAEGHGTVAGDINRPNDHLDGVDKSEWLIGAHAEGVDTVASARASHAEGADTNATGVASHTEGKETVASGTASHAEGSKVTASGYAAHAEGESTIASGNDSHAEGYGTTAEGVCAHAEGSRSVASGWGSHAEGLGTVAKTSGQHAQGKWNEVDREGKYAHIVGGGSESHRENIHTLDWSGNAWFQGSVWSAGHLGCMGQVRMFSDDGWEYELRIDSAGKLYTKKLT